MFTTFSTPCKWFTKKIAFCVLGSKQGQNGSASRSKGHAGSFMLTAAGTSHAHCSLRTPYTQKLNCKYDEAEFIIASNTSTSVSLKAWNLKSACITVRERQGLEMEMVWTTERVPLSLKVRIGNKPAAFGNTAWRTRLSPRPICIVPREALRKEALATLAPSAQKLKGKKK